MADKTSHTNKDNKIAWGMEGTSPCAIRLSSNHTNESSELFMVLKAGGKTQEANVHDAQH